MQYGDPMRQVRSQETPSRFTLHKSVNKNCCTVLHRLKFLRHSRTPPSNLLVKYKSIENIVIHEYVANLQYLSTVFLKCTTANGSRSYLLQIKFECKISIF